MFSFLADKEVPLDDMFIDKANDIDDEGLGTLTLNMAEATVVHI